MSKSRTNYKIFISNIPYTSAYQEIHDLFSTFGPIKNCVLPSKRGHNGVRNQSGTSFITFYNEASMKLALSEDSNIKLGGRELRIEVAQPKSKIGSVSGPFVNTDIIPLIERIDVKQCENQHLVELPSGVWIYILEFLDLSSLCRLEGTCRVFYWLCRQCWSVKRSLSFCDVFSLWHFKSTIGLTSELLALFLSRTGTALLSLDLSASSRFLTPGCLEVIAHYAAQLTTLDITGVQLAIEPMQKLFTCCKGIRHLCLSGCYGLSEKLLWWVINDRRDLTSLNISESKRVTGNCLRMLTGSLQHFNASGCPRLSPQAVSSLCSQSPGLLSLNLSQCYSLTPQVLQDISACPNLRSLYFTRTRMAFGTATHFYLTCLSSNTALQHLDMSHQQLLSDSFLQTLAAKATNLTSLMIPGCHKVSDIGISHLKGCRHLSTLDISYLHLITDIGLLSLQLNLHSFTARMCPGITDIGVSSIIENSSSLHHLDLSSCDQVSADCFPSLLIHLYSHNLSSSQGIHWAFGGTNVTQEEQQKFSEESGVRLTLIDSSNISFAHSLNTEMFIFTPADDSYSEIEPEPLHLSTEPDIMAFPELDHPLTYPVPAPDTGGFTLTCEENWDDDCAPNYFFDQANNTSLALAELTTTQLCIIGANSDEDNIEGDETNFLTSDDVIYSQDTWELS